MAIRDNLKGNPNESITIDTTNLSEDFTLNGLLQMLAEKYFPNAVYLYHEGNECKDISGGWNAYSYKYSSYSASSHAANAPTLTKNETNMSIKQSKTHTGTVFTENAIDVTNYNKLLVDVSFTSDTSNHLYLGLTNTKANGYSYSAQQNFAYGTSVDGIIEIDVSELSGKYYFAISTWNGDTSNIKTAIIRNIYFE